MARTRAAVYQGKLELDNVSGLRADKIRRQPIKFKKSTKIKSNRSMKTDTNTGRNGEKYS